VSPRHGARRAGLECSGAQLHSVLNAAERFMLGSVSHQVSQHAPRTVMVVRGGGGP
jgi:nucleotide-binding universal stress UspA family protein